MVRAHSNAAFQRSHRLTPSASSYERVPLSEPLLSGRRWAERARLTHNRTVQDVKFAPKHLGLKLVRRCLARLGRNDDDADTVTLEGAVCRRPAPPTARCASTRRWTS